MLNSKNAGYLIKGQRYLFIFWSSQHFHNNCNNANVHSAMCQQDCKSWRKTKKADNLIWVLGTMKMHLGESHFCEEFVHSAFRIKGKGSLRKSYLTIFLFVKYNLLLTSHPSLRHSWVQMNNTTNPCKNKRKIVIERWLSKQQTWKEKELQMLSFQKIKNKPLMKFFESASQMSQKYVTRDRRDTNTWESGDEYFL